MVTGAGALIGTLAEPLLVQPALVTVTDRPTIPDAPAVKVIPFVPCPELIVPLVMLQAYVAPPCRGTVALMPMALGQTLAGTLMATTGFALMVTLFVPLLVQPLAVTVIPRDIVPDAPALNVIELVPLPAVIVPLLMLQA